MLKKYTLLGLLLSFVLSCSFFGKTNSDANKIETLLPNSQEPQQENTVLVNQVTPTPQPLDIEVEFIGQFHVKLSPDASYEFLRDNLLGQTYYTYVWRISNPLPSAQQVTLEFKYRDKDEFLISSSESHKNYIPPNSSIVISRSINEDKTFRHESAIIDTIDVNVVSHKIDPTYTANFKILGEKNHPIGIENTGTTEFKYATVYLIAYDKNGIPIYGERSIFRLSTPPGEKERIGDDLFRELRLKGEFRVWDEPQWDTYDIIWFVGDGLHAG